MVYLLHTTNPVSFGLLFILYYASIPLAFLIWMIKYRQYLQTRTSYKLKQLGAFLAVALVVTSISAFGVTHYYVYLHSPAKSGICLTGSCLCSSDVLVRYHIDPQTLRSQGVPTYGIMMLYRMVDRGISVTTFMPIRLNSVVIVQAIPPFPGIRVYDYKVEGGKIVSKKAFFIVWPEQPGSVLTHQYNITFSVLVLHSGRKGPGV